MCLEGISGIGWPYPSQAPGYKMVNLFEKLSLEKREPLGHSAQDHLGSIFLG
jgi:hypothetical protein